MASFPINRVRPLNTSISVLVERENSYNGCFWFCCCPVRAVGLSREAFYCNHPRDVARVAVRNLACCGGCCSCAKRLYVLMFLTQAGRGRGVVARGRAGGPPARGGVANRAGRGGAPGVRGAARQPARGAARARGGSLPGK